MAEITLQDKALPQRGLLGFPGRQLAIPGPGQKGAVTDDGPGGPLVLDILGKLPKFHEIYYKACGTKNQGTPGLSKGSKGLPVELALKTG